MVHDGRSFGRKSRSKPDNGDIGGSSSGFRMDLFIFTTLRPNDHFIMTAVFIRVVYWKREMYVVSEESFLRSLRSLGSCDLAD